MLAAGGAVVLSLDNETNQFATRPRLHGSAADKFFDKMEDFGKETPYVVAVPALVGYGLIFRNEKSVKTGAELVAGLAIAQGVTQVVKRGFGRKRPYESDYPYDFFKGGRSFYSGHTISAFTFSSVLAHSYPKQNLSLIGWDRDVPLIPILAYSAAGLVGVQRLYSDVHWGSDVYVGAIAGYYIGSLVVHFGNNVHLFSLGFLPGETNSLAVTFRF